ncbi:MAG TPA: type II toxin-antitoxin system RelE/ParE family toxin [Ornithinibacter sp.]|uniref:type II toxin-antitoxin system RelE family toxin n=1 Tax=Ornithinibacter sp. TaxID=2862748 RepID=UPI001B5F9856|nr:type II toxin-antitoxin system RelE/ParE family toxin [Ornithinibacter sp.]MBP6525004.1 type II toxin-antitoxin system RelE/ParE family toxin [Dermatophilaceae bacterium]MBU9943747.1 type II toxin-antitoxin system RelE/ParE family toxin [Dermatophilaceae bacterium]HQV83258.1 type II toxin-antitoxin system RelE/ParE family toxin [Ornithinibacter sp.]HQW72982.1 type II toxin-antitoxin system RelE/ParE family toxin [Ornithinibacter sp.]HQX86655.1 type II toxin-antitoxin system RelE/ParE family
MSRWALETSPQFDKAARRLDPQILRRVRVYLDEVCDLEDPRSRGKGLSGQLSGYWRYRVGDYRVLVEIRDDSLVIVAITLGHRSGIY